MRCITPSEVEVLFGGAGFYASAFPEHGRTALRLKKPFDAQQRVGGSPPDALRLIALAAHMNEWLPPHQHRLLWVDSCDWYHPSIHETFVAVRAGLGETRSVLDAPGHYFDPFPWDELDEVDPENGTVAKVEFCP